MTNGGTKTRSQHRPLAWRDKMEMETFEEVRNLVLRYASKGMTEDRRRYLSTITSNLRRVGRTDDGLLKVRECVTLMQKSNADAETLMAMSKHLADLSESMNLGEFRGTVADVQKTSKPMLLLRARASSATTVVEPQHAYTGISRMMNRALMEITEASMHVDARNSILKSGYPDGTRPHAGFRGASASYNMMLENLKSRLRDSMPDAGEVAYPFRG
jgi:hypothetical protein